MRKKLHDDLKNASKISDNLKRQINQIKNTINQDKNGQKGIIRISSNKSIP